MKTTLIFTGALLLAGISPNPALAADPFYVSGNVGISRFSDVGPKDPATQIQHGNISTESGLNGTVAFGKHFDSFRVEAEFGYQRNDAYKISMHGMEPFRHSERLTPLLPKLGT